MKNEQRKKKKREKNHSLNINAMVKPLAFNSAALQI